MQLSTNAENSATPKIDNESQESQMHMKSNRHTKVSAHPTNSNVTLPVSKKIVLHFFISKSHSHLYFQPILALHFTYDIEVTRFRLPDLSINDPKLSKSNSILVKT